MSSAKNISALDELLRTRLPSNVYRAEVPTLAALNKLVTVPYLFLRRRPVHAIEVSAALRTITSTDYDIDLISLAAELSRPGGTHQGRRRAFQDFLLHAVDEWSRHIIDTHLQARQWHNRLDDETSSLLSSLVIGWSVITLGKIIAKVDRQDQKFWQRSGERLLGQLKFSLGHPYFVYFASLLTHDKNTAHCFGQLVRLLPYCLPVGSYSDDGPSTFLTIVP